MMAQKKAATVGIRIEPEIKDALARAADDDRRTVSSLVEKILADWLKERGYLSVPRT
jgi:hypothetical protein